MDTINEVGVDEILMEKRKLYLWLFGINIFISSFTFGGGYVVVPMIRKYFVVQRNLFSEEELMNMSAIAQSSPGAIAINLSALAGYKVAGMFGVLICCVAAIIPPIVILAIISNWYIAFIDNMLIAAVLKGMQAGVAALIVDLVVDMSKVVVMEKNILFTLMIPSSFIASFMFNINVAVILIICCGFCIINVWWKRKEGVI